jgi:uncharacterized cupin superfamily protein
VQLLKIPGLSMWSVWQPDRNVFFNSFFVRRPEGNALVDPLAASDESVERIVAMGGVALIIVTNRDHERKARDFAARFGAKIAASAVDGPLLSGPVDIALRHGDEPVSGCRVIAMQGLKSPGEIALHLAREKTAIVGDALWGDPAGAVRLLPDEKLLDPAAAVSSIRKLWALKLETLLVGDGACLFGDADRIIGEYLQSRADFYVNRINLDEIEPAMVDHRHGNYRSTLYEAGLPIGARRLGYQFVTLEPGTWFCPMHSHVLEEEMFLVWDGRPTIRTPRGSYVCRRGDVIAFPVGDAGTHQLLNESDAPCTVFLLGNAEPDEVAHYPDSNKILVRAMNRLLVRASPRLDYFDGE